MKEGRNSKFQFQLLQLLRQTFFKFIFVIEGGNIENPRFQVKNSVLSFFTEQIKYSCLVSLEREGFIEVAFLLLWNFFFFSTE